MSAKGSERVTSEKLVLVLWKPNLTCPSDCQAQQCRQTWWGWNKLLPSVTFVWLTWPVCRTVYCMCLANIKIHWNRSSVTHIDSGRCWYVCVCDVYTTSFVHVIPFKSSRQLHILVYFNLGKASCDSNELHPLINLIVFCSWYSNAWTKTTAKYVWK